MSDRGCLQVRQGLQVKQLFAVDGNYIALILGKLWRLAAIVDNFSIDNDFIANGNLWVAFHPFLSMKQIYD